MERQLDNVSQLQTMRHNSRLPMRNTWKRLVRVNLLDVRHVSTKLEPVILRYVWQDELETRC
jgi:hypothetical protein